MCGLEIVWATQIELVTLNTVFSLVAWWQGLVRFKRVVVRNHEVVSLGVGRYHNKQGHPFGESAQKWGKSVSFKIFKQRIEEFQV
jgi:hypothetical protein